MSPPCALDRSLSAEDSTTQFFAICLYRVGGKNGAKFLLIIVNIELALRPGILMVVIIHSGRFLLSSKYSNPHATTMWYNL
jgi:hypothetical protein